MKKQIFTIISTMLICVGFTACSDNGEISGGFGDQITVIGNLNTSGDSFNESQSAFSNSADGSLVNSTIKNSQSEPVEKSHGIYDETEIPDIHCENIDEEGCAVPIDGYVPVGLENMEFETHTFGEYVIKLVGYNVRTDKGNFPDRIFANLSVEVEKNGIKAAAFGYNRDITSGSAGAQYQPEQLIIPDKIGNYIDIYDIEYPVIAMRYYCTDNPKRKVMRAVDFAVLKDGEWLSGFTGFCEPGCGIDFDFENYDNFKAINVVNTEPTRCRAALFEADEFKVVNEKTLFDETAGITYTFDFTEHPVLHSLPFELYTAEKTSAQSPPRIK